MLPVPSHPTWLPLARQPFCQPRVVWTPTRLGRRNKAAAHFVAHVVKLSHQLRVFRPPLDPQLRVRLVDAPEFWHHLNVVVVKSLIRHDLCGCGSACCRARRRQRLLPTCPLAPRRRQCAQVVDAHRCAVTRTHGKRQGPRGTTPEGSPGRGPPVGGPPGGPRSPGGVHQWWTPA